MVLRVVPETRVLSTHSATKIFHVWKVRLIFKQYDGGVLEDSLTDGHEIFLQITVVFLLDVKNTRVKSLIFCNTFV